MPGISSWAQRELLLIADAADDASAMLQRAHKVLSLEVAEEGGCVLKPAATHTLTALEKAQSTAAHLDEKLTTRRSFVRNAAASSIGVPLLLRKMYTVWVETLISERGGVYALARGDQTGYDAFMYARALGLPNTPTLEAFWSFAREAADTLACLADAWLLQDTPTDPPPASTPTSKEALVVWLERSLLAFDACASLHEAASKGDVAQLARLLDQPGCGIDEQLPGWPPNGYTCLHAAAWAGHTGVSGVALGSQGERRRAKLRWPQRPSLRR